MPPQPFSSDFLHYLASLKNGQAAERIPSLTQLSKDLGLGVSTLREQLEVARALGLVEVKPRTGIRLLPYSFAPAVSQSLSYALEFSPDYFMSFADLRNRLEAAYWETAVRLLTAEDHRALQSLMVQALEKLRGEPIRIPLQEHRQLHLLIYHRLDNPFVQGLLEAYWEAYEAVGLGLYADLGYLQQVWQYHQSMVDAICAGNLPAGYRALVEHKDLLFQRRSTGTTGIEGGSSEKPPASLTFDEGEL